MRAVYAKGEKMKGALKSFGYAVYKACHEQAKYRLEHAGTSEILTLLRDDTKVSRCTNLVQTTPDHKFKESINDKETHQV